MNNAQQQAQKTTGSSLMEVELIQLLQTQLQEIKSLRKENKRIKKELTTLAD